jgi:hypothetical protein
MLVPPLAGKRLLGQKNYIIAWTGRQVADNRGLDVDSILHGLLLLFPTCEFAA